MSKPITRREDQRRRRYGKERTLNLAANITALRRNLNERFTLNAERVARAVYETEMEAQS